MSPLVSHSQHHVLNSLKFDKKICDEFVDDDKVLRSYNVTALFTSVLDKALIVMEQRLGFDETLKDWTTLSVHQPPQTVFGDHILCLYDGIFYGPHLYSGTDIWMTHMLTSRRDIYSGVY